MKPKPPTRRFIAGAVCPNCRAVDRIAIEDLPPGEADEPGAPGGAGKRRRCVSCGYTDTLRDSAVVEPARRFTRRPDRDAAFSPVRIIEPPKGRS